VTRVLVTYGSKHGGTAELAEVVAETLRTWDLHVDCVAGHLVEDVTDYDAIVIGGALYMFRWCREARRLVKRNAYELRRRAVWMFSSGPLDDSATRNDLPPVRQVAALMTRVAARGHATFGGRLAPDATGLAHQMAKTHAGDWRDLEQVREWARSIARSLEASPPVVAPPTLRPSRLLAALCLAVGTSAVVGGAGLVARPDGSLLHMPRSYLEPTPFSSYLVPGLLLLVVVGLGHLLAGFALLRRGRLGPVVAIGAGSALVTWIVTEMVLLRETNALQVIYLALGIAIVTVAVRRILATAKELAAFEDRDRNRGKRETIPGLHDRDRRDLEQVAHHSHV
jgi:menaquinone-dependent protoporphyrinogen oxidase